MVFEIPIALSNKHIHLSQEHVEELFGEGYELTQIKDLSQPGQFACDEKVDAVGPRGTLKGIRVLGPTRDNTQLEVSVTDAFTLGIPSEIRDSGDIEGTPGVKLVGPKGEVELEKGVIVAARHIHMTTEDAEKFGLVDGDLVDVKVGGSRGITFHNTLARVNDDYALEMHVDMEEGNAAGARNGLTVEMTVNK